MTDDVEQNEWCPNCGNADTWNGDECSICQPLFDSYDDIVADLQDACKNHPDFATIIHAVIQARENGPEPRHQKQHPHWSPYEYGKRQ